MTYSSGLREMGCAEDLNTLVIEMKQTLEDILSIIKNDGYVSWGGTPENGSFMTYEMHHVDTIEEDIKSVIVKVLGAAK